MPENQIRLINFPEGFVAEQTPSQKGFSWKFVKLCGPYPNPEPGIPGQVMAHPNERVIFLLAARSDNVPFYAALTFLNDTKERSDETPQCLWERLLEGIGIMAEQIDGGKGGPDGDFLDHTISESQRIEAENPGEDHSLKTFFHHPDGGFDLEEPCQKST